MVRDISGFAQVLNVLLQLGALVGGDTTKPLKMCCKVICRECNLLVRYDKQQQWLFTIADEERDTGCVTTR